MTASPLLIFFALEPPLSTLFITLLFPLPALCVALLFKFPAPRNAIEVPLSALVIALNPNALDVNRYFSLLVAQPPDVLDHLVVHIFPFGYFVSDSSRYKWTSRPKAE
jgi:hypothetical protein